MILKILKFYSTQKEPITISSQQKKNTIQQSKDQAMVLNWEEGALETHKEYLPESPGYTVMDYF